MKGGRCGVINRDGDYIVAAEYDSITIDDSGESILFFNAEPYEYHNFPESYSGFYAIWDDQLVELFMTGKPEK